MNTATFALAAFVIGALVALETFPAAGALVALESFPGTLVALALAGALVDLALAGALVDLAFVGALVGVALAGALVDLGMDIFNLRDDAGCRPRARACGSMPKYGSNASSLVSCALANGTAAAKQRMATTAMDSFIAMVGREPSWMVCVLCCCVCESVVCMC